MLDSCTEDETAIDDVTELDCVTLDWFDDVDCPTDADNDTILLEDITLDCCAEDETDIDDAVKLDWVTLDCIDDVAAEEPKLSKGNKYKIGFK